MAIRLGDREVATLAVSVRSDALSRFRGAIGCAFVTAGLCFGLCFASPAYSAVYSGTGFFITTDGYFVTSYHVVEGAKKIEIRLPSGQRIPAESVLADRENDVALLKASGKFSALPLISSSNAKRGMEVITLGFPHVSIQGTDAKLTDGVISSLSGLESDSRFFQVTVPVQSGNSGGPLVTREGNVIGVIAAKLNAVAMLKQTGDLAQNVNFAVKSNFVLELMRSAGVSESKLIRPRKASFTRLAELGAAVEKGIAMVIAENDYPSKEDLQRQADEAKRQADEANRQKEATAREQERQVFERQRSRNAEIQSLQQTLSQINQAEAQLYQMANSIQQEALAIQRRPRSPMDAGGMDAFRMGQLQAQAEQVVAAMSKLQTRKQEVTQRLRELSQ